MNAGTARTAGAPSVALDVARIRRMFPILHQEVHGHPLVYLDNAATTQKPQQVLEAIDRYYKLDNANVHRGVHLLSERATRAYEAAREKVRAFLNARSTKEIVFTRGTTEAINLVAQSWGRAALAAGDEIVTSTIEHHSNIVPWQILCEQTGATLRVIPVEDSGRLDMDAFHGLLNERTRLVAVGHVSNALGTVNPVREITEAAHAVGALVLLDGAQATPHMHVDVQAIGCDFYALSGHKMYGPTGIGVLWAREEVLGIMPPYQGGGDMISSVSFEGTTYNELPYRFEAGTPDIAGAIGLGAAIDFLEETGIEAIARHEHDLLEYATRRLGELDKIRIIGTAPEKAAVISFEVQGVHPHDVGSLLDHEGVAVRTGHHCAQPTMERFGVPATTRASFAVYNSREDVDRLVDALKTVLDIFA